MRDKFFSIVVSLLTVSSIIVAFIFGLIIFDEINNTLPVNVDKFEYSQNLYTQENRVENEVANEKVKEKDISKTIENNIEVPKIVEKSPLDEIESTSSSNSVVENVDYSDINVNKYFYNQLGEYSKVIYKAFEANKENMKTGTYKIEMGSVFSSVLSQANGSELLGNYYQSAIEAYTYDNPDVFYLSPSKMYLNIETRTRGTTKTYNVFVNSGNQPNYLTDEFQNKEQIDSAISQIEQARNQILRNKSGNTYNNIKMVHDYLVDNISYDESLSEKYIYNIYGALVQKECVCEGYARSMKYLLDALGVNCVVVIGKGTNSQGQTENHAWNYVELDNKWYAIDTTWDDPVIIGGGSGERYKYRYFLKGSTEMNNDHVPNGQFTQDGKVFEYPELSMYSYS